MAAAVILVVVKRCGDRYGATKKLYYNAVVVVMVIISGDENGDNEINDISANLRRINLKIT